VIYTQMLNGRGGIECVLTATRIDDDRYVLVTGTAFGNHDIGWIRKQLGNERGKAVTVRDATGSMGCFGLWGPRARDILSSVTPDDLSNEAFPYMTARQIVVGDVPCLALRVTYVGELGWELYPNVEFAGTLWDTLVTAGEPFEITPAGYRAIDSLRLEKGYRAWGADITPEEHPFEAGLGFAVRMDVPGFIGNEALEQVLARGVTRRLSCLTLSDPRAMTLGNEPVYRSDEVVSRVTSGGLGYSVGASIAHAYLPIEAAVAGTVFQVEVFGERVPAAVADEPLWDPKGERIRA
jgi:4-methylaminobutanoate oxidase (formaldehyde-forming)